MTPRASILSIVAMLTAGAALLPLTGCDLLGSENDPPETDAVYPMYVDANDNGVNDYVEEPTHEPGSSAGKRASQTDGELPGGPAPPGHAFVDEDGDGTNDYVERHSHRGPTHAFVDENGDGVCDLAQDGSPTWHGPGYVDENGNGRYDHWEPGGRGHGGPHAGSGRMGGMNGSER